MMQKLPSWTSVRPDITFLLLPKFSGLELFCAIEPLRIANRLAATGFAWRFVSADGQAVTASNGMPFAVAGPLSALADAPILFVAASFEPEARAGRAVHDHLRRLARHGSLLGAVDTGAFVLARAGLLGGRRVTLHWESLAAFAEEFPGIEATSRVFELDRDRLTCAGGVAPVDMMLHLVALRAGETLAHAVAEQIMHPRIRPGSDPQRLEPQARYRVADPRLLAAIAAMEATLAAPLPVAEVARRAGLSQRQMTRLFQMRFQRTPKQFYVDLRLELARQILTDSAVPVTAAALAAGFENPAHFARIYRRAFGRQPSAARVATSAP